MNNIRNILAILICTVVFAQSLLAEPSSMDEGFRKPSYKNFQWVYENKFAIGIFRVKVDDGTKDIFAYEGEITKNTTEIINFFHEQYPEITEIAFNSPGGTAYESFELGAFLSNKGFSVTVPAGRICLSACAFAFIGGTDYLIDGTLGFHVAWVDFEEDTTFDENDVNSGYRAGQLLGNQMTIWFMQNGFTPHIATQIAYKTDKSKFLVFRHEDELNQWYTRNDIAENDISVNYLYPDIPDEDVAKLKIMDSGQLRILTQTTAGHTSRGREIEESVLLWPIREMLVPAVPGAQ